MKFHLKNQKPKKLQTLSSTFLITIFLQLLISTGFAKDDESTCTTYVETTLSTLSMEKDVVKKFPSQTNSMKAAAFRKEIEKRKKTQPICKVRDFILKKTSKNSQK